MLANIVIDIGTGMGIHMGIDTRIGICIEIGLDLILPKVESLVTKETW